MYLEVTFGLTCALLLQAVRDRSWGLSFLILIALVSIGSCTIFTLTRSGLLSLGAVLLGSGLLWWRARGVSRCLWALVGLGLILGCVFGLRLLTDEGSFWLRLTTQTSQDWYQVDYQVPESLELVTGELQQIEVAISNTGLAAWDPKEAAPTTLAYHWLVPESKEVFDFEGLRTSLSRPVKPGQGIVLQAQVRAPAIPGRYLLAWDMLREDLFWFSLEGCPSAYTRVEVRGPMSKGLPTRPLAAMPAPRFVLSRWQLWSTALEMIAANPILGVGPDNFRLLYGRYAGLEIWDRSYHTNNLYLEFFVCTGLLGGSLFLWLLWRLLWVLRRQWKLASHQTLPQALGVLAAILAILVHGFFDYFLEFTPNYLMIWSSLGLAVAALRLEEE